MKKLLALILCVMMFVAVIPTSAFAAAPAVASWPTIENPLDTVAQYKKEISNMVKETKKSLESAYGVLVSDQVVYGTAKGMDDTIVGLVDAISKKLIEDNTTIVYPDGSSITITKNYVDGVKDQVRLLIDSLVSADMAKTYKYAEFNADGSIKKIDPIKYAQTFSKAVSDALTNKKFMKGYEAVATFFALGQLVKDTNDKLKDEYDLFKESVDSDFDKKFENRYPQLWEQYIDTLNDASTGNYGARIDPWALFPKAAVTMS